MSNITLFDRDEFLTPFDKVFDNIFASAFPNFSKEFGVDVFKNSSYPKCDVVLFDDKAEFVFEIPGISKEDITIDVDNRILCVSGQKAQTTEDAQEGRYLLRELKRSAFKRSFKLGDNFDADNIKARFDSGILTLTVPRVEPEVKTKKLIEIE